MDLTTIIVILGASAAMIFIITVAKGLERSAQGLPVLDFADYGWTSTIAYVFIMFGVVAGLVQLYRTGRLSLLGDLVPVTSGFLWLTVGLRTLRDWLGSKGSGQE